MDFGVLSLLPSLIAIGLAIKTKNVIFSLFCGCLTGVLLLCHGNPFLASKALIGDYFFKQVMDSYNAGNIVLILFIGGFIKKNLAFPDFEPDGDDGMVSCWKMVAAPNPLLNMCIRLWIPP